jgi:hypothetical protein
MIIIKEISTNTVLYMFNDGTNVDLRSDRLVTDAFQALDIKSDTHTIETDVTEPDHFIGGAYSYDNGIWAVGNQEVLDRILPDLKESLKAKVKASFARKAKRPIVDTGLGYSVQGSYEDLADFQIGREVALPMIRAEDNEFYEVDDAGYAIILQAIKVNSLRLKQAKWSHLNAIDALTSVSEAVEYDITTGWT